MSEHNDSHVISFERVKNTWNWYLRPKSKHDKLALAELSGCGFFLTRGDAEANLKEALTAQPDVDKEYVETTRGTAYRVTVTLTERPGKRRIFAIGKVFSDKDQAQQHAVEVLQLLKTSRVRDW